MSNGGPHGDKWNMYPVADKSCDQILHLLNTPVEGKYASAAFVYDGVMYVANYGTE